MLTFYQQFKINYNFRFLFVLLMLSFSTTACNADEANKTQYFLTTATVKGQQLALHDQKGQCAIRFNKAVDSTVLKIPYPCGFVRSSSKKIAQTYYYKAIGNVLVIAGPAVKKSVYSEDDSVNPKHFCSNRGQAVIVQGSKLTLRKPETVALGFCHQLGFDEKSFYGYAYPVKN